MACGTKHAPRLRQETPPLFGNPFFGIADSQTHDPYNYNHQVSFCSKRIVDQLPYAHMAASTVIVADLKSGVQNGTLDLKSEDYRKIEIPKVNLDLLCGYSCGCNRTWFAKGWVCPLQPAPANTCAHPCKCKNEWKEGGWICWPTVQSADYKHQVEDGTGASQIQVMNAITGEAELIIAGDDFFTADKIKMMLARKNGVDLKYASNAWTLFAEDGVQPLPEFKLWNRITFKEAFGNKLLIKSVRMQALALLHWEPKWSAAHSIARPTSPCPT